MKHELPDMNQLQSEIKEYYHTPANRRLKYFAFAAIGIAVVLLLVMTFWLDELSLRTLLFMRGCAGLCALVFVVLVAVLTFRVYNAYFQNRNNR